MEMNCSLRFLRSFAAIVLVNLRYSSVSSVCSCKIILAPIAVLSVSSGRVERGIFGCSFGLGRWDLPDPVAGFCIGPRRAAGP